ncbi:uncharacterized protein LOC143042706 [Mytilus galloprovincialis]|uniref:uncharacterized protein LOC143042706 n=1 Tax=Mytilus galloprovincialis TaxID=29158 RepID=UPI003F7BE1ED
MGLLILNVFVVLATVHLSTMFNLRTTLITLDDTNTKLLDSFLRIHLESQTLELINRTIMEKEQLEHNCIQQANNTIDMCITCMHTCDAAQLPPVHYIQSENHSSGNKLKVVLKEIIKDPLGTAIDLVFDLGVGKLTNGVEHVVHQLGHEAEHLGKDLVHGVQHVGEELGKGVEHLAHELSHGAEHVAHEIGHGVQHLGHELEHLGHGVESVIHDLGHGVEHIGHEIEHGVHHIGHEISHILGKRQSCGDRCPACNNVKSKNLSEIKTKVCGSSYVNRISTLDSLEPKIRKVAAALKNRFIQKIEYDPTSLDPATVQFRNVYVTVFKTGSLTRFKTKAPYQMMHMENTASHWASEALAMFID